MRLVILMSLSLVGLVFATGCEKKSTQETAPEATAQATSGEEEAAVAAVAVADREVEAGCAMCTYHMEGVKGCTLAAKIDGKPYLVEGSDVNAHNAGLCQATKKAICTGEAKGDTLVVSAFELQE